MASQDTSMGWDVYGRSSMGRNYDPATVYDSNINESGNYFTGQTNAHGLRPSNPSSASHNVWGLEYQHLDDQRAQQQHAIGAAQTLSTLSAGPAAQYGQNTSYHTPNPYNHATWSQVTPGYQSHANIRQLSSMRGHNKGNSSERTTTPMQTNQQMRSSFSPANGVSRISEVQNIAVSQMAAPAERGSSEYFHTFEPRQNPVLSWSRPVQLASSVTEPVTSRPHSGHSRAQTLTPSTIQQETRQIPTPVHVHETQIHNTVNPSQVYDPYPEQQRQADRAAEERRRIEAEKIQVGAEEERRAAATAIAAAAAAEVEKAIRDAENAQQQQQSPVHDLQGQPAASSPIPVAFPARDQAAMEGEMKTLFERMRYYNSINPDLLGQLWEKERRLNGAQQQAERPLQASIAVNGKEASAQTFKAGQQQQARSTTATSTPANSKRPRGRPRKQPLPESVVVSADQQREPVATKQRPTNDKPVVDLLIAGTSPVATNSIPIMDESTTTEKPNETSVRTSSATPPLLDSIEIVVSNARATTDPTADKASVRRSPSPLQGDTVRQSDIKPEAIKTDKSSSRTETEQADNAASAMTKEQAARKRKFSDLVDLTNDDSEDDEVIPRHNLKNTWTPPTTLDAPLGSERLAIPTSVPRMTSPQRKYTQARLNAIANQVLVQGIKRERIARKDKYDPRTIARDVLLATGRHPEMRALNGHLFALGALLGTHSDGAEGHKYDLSTIRWDLLDPGELVNDGVEITSDAGGEADDESDGERAPTMAMTASIVVARSNNDSTTTLISAMPQASLKSGYKVKRKRPDSATARLPRTRSRSESFGPRGVTIGSNRKPTAGTKPMRDADARRPQKAPETKRRETQVTIPVLQAGTTNAAVGYTAFRSQQIQYDENGQPRRRMGRPVGWRKDIHGKAAQEGSSTPSTKVGNKDRPPRPNGGAAKENLSDPQYAVFECLWQGCHAKLHNLNTLRRHIVKIHGAQTRGVYSCQWSDCFDAQSETLPRQENGKSSMTSTSFTSIHKWMAHIEGSHLRGLAQSLGDGPRRGLSDPYDSEASQAAYLSDASGRIVTPRSVVDQTIAEEDEHLQAQALAPVLRQGMPRLRGRLSLADREDEQKLQSLEAKKLVLGPLLERGGCRLANDKRRRGFYDDEDFAEDVSADDGPEWGEEGN